MSVFSNIDFNAAVDRVFDAYTKLIHLGSTKSKLGEQWTHLAAICSFSVDRGEITLLCMATGTKCLGAKDIDHHGFRVNDSHAEVLCRRVFIKFLMDEIDKMLSQDDYESAYLIKCTVPAMQNIFEWRSNQKLIMVLTHTPCGDASIFQKLDSPNNDDPPPCKTSKKDINRTGARSVIGQAADPCLPGADYHCVGSFRTKPGRGDPTLSMSCSDKMAKWQILGLQGSLLSHFITTPIRANFIVVTSEHYSEDSMKRALCYRNPAGSDYKLEIVNVRVKFVHGKPVNRDNLRPNPISLVWNKNMQRPEYLVNGYRQGANIKKLSFLAGRSDEKAQLALCSCVCRRKLSDKYLTLLEKSEEMTKIESSNYLHFKMKAEWYREKWRALRTFYKYWIADERKLSVQNFPIK
uniref:tRNA-specific adenosine deaminase 1 n=1 Tax=Romanomermis culicivorax TaxID=13658 RepID=A0A915IDS0_ROMCU